MSEYLLDTEVSEDSRPFTAGRRSEHGIEELFVLSPLDADAVLDQLDSPSEPVELITFGTVRETCLNCPASHLKLVLRQRRVRVAHLFCSGCLGCFDAHYSNGRSALTF